MVSCHTALIDGYVIEGHVRPLTSAAFSRSAHAVGLAVPGMPYGSPGMGQKTTARPMMSSSSARTGRRKSFRARRRIIWPAHGKSVSNNARLSRKSCRRIAHSSRSSSRAVRAHPVSGHTRSVARLRCRCDARRFFSLIIPALMRLSRVRKQRDACGHRMRFDLWAWGLSP